MCPTFPQFLKNFLLDKDTSHGDYPLVSIVFDGADYVNIVMGCEILESRLEIFMMGLQWVSWERRPFKSLVLSEISSFQIENRSSLRGVGFCILFSRGR